MPNSISFQPGYAAYPAQKLSGSSALHWQCQDQVSFRGKNEKEDPKTAKPEKEPWHWGQRFKNSLKGGIYQLKRSLTSPWIWGALGVLAVASLIPGVHLFTCSTIPLWFAIDFGIGAVFNFTTDQKFATNQQAIEDKKKNKKP